MGVATGSGCEQEAGVASGSGWNLWGWRFIDFLILLIPTPLVSVLFCSSITTFCSFFNLLLLFIFACPSSFKIYVRTSEIAPTVKV